MVVLAQEEARLNECEYIAPEHILVGILREEEGLGSRSLVQLGVNIEVARKYVKELSDGPVPDGQGRQLPFTPRAKKCLELALRDALTLGHNYIGTEHILLGLLREGDNKGLEILKVNFGLEAEQIRTEVIRMLSGPKAPILTKATPDSVDSLKEHKKADREYELLLSVVALARDYEDASPSAIINAARALHG